MKDLVTILDRFTGRRIVVLGDLAVDCYVDTHPSRLSREAPVMILQYEGRRYLPGCAANTVLNLRSLGAEVAPIGIVGDDEAGKALLDCFRAAGIPLSGITVRGRSVVKVRILSGDYSRLKQQVMRVDVEPAGHPDENTYLELIARAGIAEGAEGIVVSDYGYGAASPGLLRAAQGVAPKARVSVDSRTKVGEFTEVDLLTPNEQEAGAYVHRPVESDEEAQRAAQELRSATGAGAVLLTRGNRGMILAEQRLHSLPIHGSTEIVDPTGAGDTVVAAATLARAAGASYLDAARIANVAASVSVMKSGAVAVTLAEVAERLARG